MNKNDIQSVVINLLAQSYLTRCKISAIEATLNQIVEKIDPEYFESLRYLNHRCLETAVLRAHETDFLAGLNEENDLILQRIRELAPTFF